MLKRAYLKAPLAELKIGVLMGGLGPEREISLRSGQAVLDALKSQGLRAHQVLVGRDLDQTLRAHPIDIAFVALHGHYGEDGSVQGLLELLGIPYTGPGVLASALAMDKLKSKELFVQHGIPTPDFVAVKEDDLPQVAALTSVLSFPVFVKPRRCGSSVGVGRAQNPEELRERCKVAFQYDSFALVERFVTGRDLTIGVLNKRALGALEIAPKEGVYDYHAKYTPGRTDYHSPPRVSAACLKRALELAEKAALALDADSAVRLDTLVTETEEVLVLELNTVPGMTPQSLLPRIAQAAGQDFRSLCRVMVESARLWNPGAFS